MLFRDALESHDASPWRAAHVSTAALAVEDPVEIGAFMHRNDFATIVGPANPHWMATDSTEEFLVVFSGSHGYVSPTWYSMGAGWRTESRRRAGPRSSSDRDDFSLSA